MQMELAEAEARIVVQARRMTEMTAAAVAPEKTTGRQHQQDEAIEGGNSGHVRLNEIEAAAQKEGAAVDCKGDGGMPSDRHRRSHHRGASSKRSNRRRATSSCSVGSNTSEDSSPSPSSSSSCSSTSSASSASSHRRRHRHHHRGEKDMASRHRREKNTKKKHRSMTASGPSSTNPLPKSRENGSTSQQHLNESVNDEDMVPPPPPPATASTVSSVVPSVHEGSVVSAASVAAPAAADVVDENALKRSSLSRRHKKHDQTTTTERFVNGSSSNSAMLRDQPLSHAAHSRALTRFIVAPYAAGAATSSPGHRSSDPFAAAAQYQARLQQLAEMELQARELHLRHNAREIQTIDKLLSQVGILQQKVQY
jgi:hypothetical protein